MSTPQQLLGQAVMHLRDAARAAAASGLVAEADWKTLCELAWRNWQAEQAESPRSFVIDLGEALKRSCK